MILSDVSIREELLQNRIIIDPLDFKNIQPSSIDFRLGNKFLMFKKSDHWIDPQEPQSMTEIIVEKDFLLYSNDFALGVSLENLTLPNNIVCQVNGKSSLARLGLLIHVTSGFVDPGWSGNLTLELHNVSPLPILLRPGMKIGQFVFMKLTTAAEHPYGSDVLNNKYKWSVDPISSKHYLDTKEYNIG